MRLFIPLLLGLICLSGEAHALRFTGGQVVFDKRDDFQTCQQMSYTGQFCMDALDRWVAGHKEDPFAVAVMVRRTMNAQAALPYFAKAGDLAPHCADKDLNQAVMAGLSLPEADRNVIDMAHDIAFNTCFNDMRGELKKNMTDETFFKNTCHAMADKAMLGDLQAKKCGAM